MFPLGTVLFPGALLPLHIFEERYRQLVKDCLADEPEFGVVLIDRGHEVGGGDVRREVGTVRAHPGGRGAAGRSLLHPGRGGPQDPRAVVARRRAVPRADVQEWPDEDASLATTERVAQVANQARVRALASELHEGAGPLEIDIADDPLLASYHLCAVAPVGSDDGYKLLACPGPVERLDRLDDLLADAETVLQLRLGSGEG